MPQLIPNFNENLGFTANYPYTLLVKSFKSHTILVYLLEESGGWKLGGKPLISWAGFKGISAGLSCS